jgi:hypothetical protein
MAFTFISTNRIASAGLAVLFEGRMCKILSKGPNREVIAEIPQVEGLYSVVSQHQERMSIVKTTHTIHELHKILGHVSQAAVKHAISEGLIDGLALDTLSSEEFCEACVKVKSTHKPFPKEATRRAQTYGEVIHMDLWGPAQTVSLAGSSYYMSFTDDYSRESQVTFLKQKSEALEAFKHYEARLTTQKDGVHIKTLRSDRGGEYLSAEFDVHLKDHGIKHKLTTHDSPQQNGVAERLNRTLVEHARAMLIAHGLPKFLWVEVVNYAVWLKNRLPSRSIPGHTPYELVHQMCPNLSCAHEFGSPVLVHLEHAGKLKVKAEEAFFVGVDGESKAFRVYWLTKRRVSIEWNITFVPPSVVVADGVQVEGESTPTQRVSAQDPLQQNAPIQGTQRPSTPPRPSQPPITPPAPRPTRVRPPPGYYAALNEGETATLAAEVPFDPAESDLADEEALTRWQQQAMAAAVAEPTLSQALSGPDAVEWQEAIDYEIS